jgi:hypothetical protein
MARAPPTWGAANEVPEADAYSPPRSDVTIATPGAVTAGTIAGLGRPHELGPRLLLLAIVPALSIAPTAKASGLFPGLLVVSADGP